MNPLRESSLSTASLTSSGPNSVEYFDSAEPPNGMAAAFCQASTCFLPIRHTHPSRQEILSNHQIDTNLFLSNTSWNDFAFDFEMCHGWCCWC